MAFSNRPFGLETECFAPTEMVREAKGRPIEAVGLWLPTAYRKRTGDRLAVQVKGDADFDPTAGLSRRVWGLEPDGSLSQARGGVEVISPKLSGLAGRDHVFEVISILNRGGFYVTQDAGCHVHHAATPDTGFDLKAWKRLAANFYVLEPAFDRLMNSNRNYNMGSGPAASVRSVAKNGHHAVMERIASATSVEQVIHHAYDDMYLEMHFKLAMDKYPEKGTAEWRHHHGTVDPHAATAWITLTQQVMDHSAFREDLLVPDMRGSDFMGAADYIVANPGYRDDRLLDRLLTIESGPDGGPSDVEVYYRAVVAHREKGAAMPREFAAYAQPPKLPTTTPSTPPMLRR